MDSNARWRGPILLWFNALPLAASATLTLHIVYIKQQCAKNGKLYIVCHLKSEYELVRFIIYWIILFFRSPTNANPYTLYGVHISCMEYTLAKRFFLVAKYMSCIYYL